MSHTSVDTVVAFAFEIRSLVNELNTALAAAFRPLGLTGVQAEAIMALDDVGPVTLKDLSTRLVAESGHPSRLLTRLTNEGLVTRRQSEADGRAVILELTARGRFLARQAREARAPLIQAWAESFGDGLDDLTSLLRDIRDDVRSTEAVSDGP